MAKECFECGRSDKPLVSITIEGKTRYICKSFDCADVLYDELMKIVDRKHKKISKSKKPKGPRPQPKPTIEQPAPKKRAQRSKKKKRKINRKYTPMNKALQVSMIRRLIGEDHDKIDIEAEVDPTLSLPENLQSMRAKGLMKAQDNVEAKYEIFKREYQELHGQEFDEELIMAGGF